jgi:hypothetical protein
MSRVFLLLLITALAVPLAGEVIEPFVMPSARAGALGGVHAAFADDFYVLFTNPAAMVDIEQEFSAAEITLSMYGPVFEILDVMSDYSGSDDPLDISGLVGKNGFATGFDLGGPLAVGTIGRGLGLGLFNRTKSDAVVTGTVIRPVLSEEFLFLGGYSFRLLNKKKHFLDMGFFGKGFYRGLINLETSIFDASNLFNSMSDHAFSTYLGLGFDLGLQYTFADDLSVALVCYDVYSPVLITNYASFSDFRDKTGTGSNDYATVRRRLDLGVAYRIHSNFLDRYISNFVVMTDYQDLLDLTALIPRNPILQVGIGAELVILNVFSLRIGIADALPAVGFGLDLRFMKLDCAIRGKELGLDPGVQPVYAIDMGLLFRY